MSYNLIVAVCRQNGMGWQGRLPWQIKREMDYFTQLTKGDGNNAVIMGRKTWESLPKLLTDRDNLVLSTTAKAHSAAKAHNAKFFASFDAIDAYLAENDYYEDIWIIGGAEIYQHYLATNKINKCYITYIDKDFECDTFFPPLDMTRWKAVAYEKVYDICELDYVVYERIDYGSGC